MPTAFHITFFGTHPTFTQVPPSRPDSITALFAPYSAARCAKASPPLPPPMLMRSNASLDTDISEIEKGSKDAMIYALPVRPALSVGLVELPREQPPSGTRLLTRLRSHRGGPCPSGARAGLGRESRPARRADRPARPHVRLAGDPGGGAELSVEPC